jgi:hypothetical protein
LSDEEDWEPVVCGPYEHTHALALAEEVVADEELMAVVEPLMGLAAPDDIREEITIARAAAQVDAHGDLMDEFDELDEAPEAGFDEDVAPRVPGPVPTPAEIRAGMARIARRLAD